MVIPDPCLLPVIDRCRFDGMKILFTQKQSWKMYQALVEIHGALQDKVKSKRLGLSICESAWLLGIDKLLNDVGRKDLE